MSASDEEVRLTLRLPASLRDRIAKEAEKSGRSMNGEMVYRLEKTIVDDDTIARHESEIIELYQKVDQLEANLDELARHTMPHKYDWK